MDTRTRIASITALSLALQLPFLHAADTKNINADEAQNGNPASAAFDSDASTKWAANGRGHWIQCEFSEPLQIDQIGIGFQHGERDYAFDIATSDDGKNWVPGSPTRFQSGGGGEEVSLYKITPRKAQFLRVTAYGSNENEWANIHTIHIPGVTPSAPKLGEFVVTEWASDPAIANTVAISLDDWGRAYVTAARRRKQSSLDIRNHQDLVKRDLSLTTVEERRAWYREYLTDRDWVPDRNGDGKKDWQDLTVQIDKVIQVSDADGDGKGETLRTVSEHHSEVTGIVAGVLEVDGDVFVAAEPDFLRYTDEDGDGFPEKKQLVATGFQVHMGQGGHNLSGVTLGPDGRVYWSLGDKGHYVETKEGKVYHAPNSGGIFRCELDGSNVERYSSGERNAQELAFDAHGNLFSMDNDGDYPGEMERALYITEGSEHGWRLNWQWLRKQDFTKISGIKAYNPWMDERLFLPHREDHAAYLTPTIGNFGPGPCGFVANPGTALSEELADCFFMTNQKNEVRVFTFAAKGATFAFEERAPIKGGVNNTGLAIGPDGALYSASYGGKRGSIFRFDVTEENRHALRAETQEILESAAENAEATALMAWLDHADQRVRMKGQFELARRKAFTKLFEALFDQAKTPLGRIHAVWGLGQISRSNPGIPLMVLPAWSRADEPELIAQATKVIGEMPATVGNISVYNQQLIDGLKHASPRVRFFSAIAIGSRKIGFAAPKVVQFLERDATDPYLRHAGVMGLQGTLSPKQLAELSTHENRTVRLSAIVALRKLAAPEIRAFLKKENDELVLLEAARAIHDDASIPDALSDLSGVLDRKGFTNEALMRRVINAAFRSGSGVDLQRLEDYLARADGSTNLRRTALASILWWSQPPVLDAVEGRYRKHEARDGTSADIVVARLKGKILADVDLREVLLNGVAVRGQGQWLEGIAEQTEAWPAKLQVRLLDALAKSGSADLRAAVERGLQSEHADVRVSARQHATKAGVPLLDLLLAILDDSKPAGQGKAVLQLAEIDDPRAQKKLAELTERYRNGKADPHWKLELWQAAKAKGIALPETPDRLEHGGDPGRGKKLVMEHAAAQCIRCHKIGKDAATETAGIGPELTKIGATRDRAYLLRSLLEPTKEIADGFGVVLLKTKAGEEISGVLSKQTDEAWTITLADGTARAVKPSEVESHTLTSAMPPVGLRMKPAEIRDVVSYLAGLR